MEKKSKEEKSLAEVLWEEINDKPIDMFSLPNQKVSQYCAPQKVEPSKLYLVVKAMSVLPALEDALKGKYVVGTTDKWVTVERVKVPYKGV